MAAGGAPVPIPVSEPGNKITNREGEKIGKILCIGDLEDAAAAKLEGGVRGEE